MSRTSVRLTTVVLAGIALACAPELVPPEEAVRVVGKVVPEEAENPEGTDEPKSGGKGAGAADGTAAEAAGAEETEAAASDLPVADAEAANGDGPGTREVPVRIVVHERCSPQFVLFEECPGKRLGEAKIPKPGPFLIDVDTKREAIVVFAWPEAPGVASATCGSVTKKVSELGEPLEVPLSGSECPRRQPLYY